MLSGKLREGAESLRRQRAVTVAVGAMTSREAGGWRQGECGGRAANEKVQRPRPTGVAGSSGADWMRSASVTAGRTVARGPGRHGHGRGKRRRGPGRGAGRGEGRPHLACAAACADARDVASVNKAAEPTYGTSPHEAATAGEEKAGVGLNTENAHRGTRGCATLDG